MTIWEIKDLEDLNGKKIIMCPKCKTQVTILEEDTIISDMNIKYIYIQGVPLIRFRKLIELFMKEGFDLKKNKDWRELKRHFFNIIKEEDLKDE